MHARPLRVCQARVRRAYCSPARREQRMACTASAAHALSRVRALTERVLSIPERCSRCYALSRVERCGTRSKSTGDLPMHRLTKISAVAAIVLLTANLAHAADKSPNATFELCGGSVAAGVGYTWGKGTLHYNGTDYP